MALKIENLKDEITGTRNDIEPTFDKSLIETINQPEGENKKLNDKIKLLETENKILKNDMGTRQKLIDSLLQHNDLLITQQERLTTQLLTTTSESSCRGRNKDVMQTENNIRQEEVFAKTGMSEGNKSPSNRVIQSIETKNCYSPLETEENPTENGNKTTYLPNTKITAKQSAINIAPQNIQSFNDKAEKDTPDKRKLLVTVILGDSMVNDIKAWKMSSRTRKVVLKHFSGAKTKDTKPHIIVKGEEKFDNIILHTRANSLKTIDTPEEITMGIINLEMTHKTHTKRAFISVIFPRSEKFHEKDSNINNTLRHKWNVRKLFFIDNKHISLRFHCNRIYI